MTEEPFDDYLWDATGEPDPRLRELERLLSRFRHSHRPPVFAEEGETDGDDERDG
jgi:hypothetical protein